MSSTGARVVAALVALAALVAGLLWLRARPSATGATSVSAPRAATVDQSRATRTVSTGATAGAPVSTTAQAVPATAAHEGEVVVNAKWGGSAGEVGRRRDPESNPEMPMAIAPLSDGSLAVLDQVNRRVVRWRDGKPQAIIALGGDTAQDVAAVAGGRTAVLDRLGDRNVQVYGSDGKLENSIDLRAAGDPGHVTGLFADDDGIFVEREHRELVRIADGGGRSLPSNEASRLGRPSRDGKWLLSVEIADRAAGVVSLRGVDRALAAGAPTAFEGPLALGGPIVHIVALDSDGAGRVIVAAAVGEGADEALVVARVRVAAPGVVAAGLLRLPPLVGADETFRPVAVDDAGAVLVSYAEPAGMIVRRYVFP